MRGGRYGNSIYRERERERAEANLQNAILKEGAILTKGSLKHDTSEKADDNSEK